MKNKQNRYFSGQIPLFILIFFLLATLMISSAIIELQQSKKELYQLMSKQSHSLLQSLIIASKNTIRTGTYLDEVTNMRLLDNASLIKNMYEEDRISNRILADICVQNNIFRIHIFQKNGKRIYSSHQQKQFQALLPFNSIQFLDPLFSGIKDTIQIGYRESRGKAGYRYAVALAAKDRSAIVLNIDASEMLKFKMDIDFGALIRQITEANPQIIYIALQDTSHILAASGSVRYLKNPDRSAFFQTSFYDSTFQTRIIESDSISVFEAVHPFIFDDDIIGLFRMGLSLQPIEDINKRIYRRLIIITLILIIIGFVLFVYIFTRQRLSLLQKQYTTIETYSSNIISNVSDAIIVLDSGNCIKVFNDAAETLFKQGPGKILGKKLDKIFSNENYSLLMEEYSLLNHIRCEIAGQQLYLLVSQSRFEDTEGNKNTILVIRDLTRQRQLESQLERKQRLTAMGELASGVAHEIRNPLNTIGTIIQQLNKDFEPETGSEEYHELAELVHSEVKRINDTVQDFLRFARPEPVEQKDFPLSDFIRQIQKQYESIVEKQNIKLSIHSDWDGQVFWDEGKMKQVLINLIQNSIEAIGNNGQIEIHFMLSQKNELEIHFKDDGPGLDANIKDKIFNLYFTTKAKGTGIGLSIVQRIIYEHGGIISVDENVKHGTIFIIRLPITKNKID